MSDESTTMGGDLSALVDDAEDCLADVDDCLEGVESVDELGDDDREELFASVDRLVDLVDELEDALDAIDLTELLDSVDGTAVLEAIDVGEIPDALGDGDAGDVVELRPLIRAIDLAEAWNAADVHELWDAKGDLEATAEELTDEDDGGMVAEAIDTATDVGESVTGDEDDELLEGDVGDVLEDEFGEQFDLADGESFGFGAEDTQAYQEMIQVQAIEGVEELREAVLYAHEKFRKLYEFNREKMRRQDTSTHSRNPTAVSTMPTERADLGSTARSTTVPRQVKGSTAPGFDRIYGRRFERELEKRRGETDG